jgi:hypothetical protein
MQMEQFTAEAQRHRKSAAEFEGRNEKRTTPISTFNTKYDP